MITLNKVDEVLQHEGKEYALFEVSKITALLEQNKEFKNDSRELKDCIIQVLRIMGLLDEEKLTIKDKIKTGEESYFKHILKALKDVVFLITEAKIGIKSAEVKLTEKFSFIKNIIPLIEKHGNK